MDHEALAQPVVVAQHEVFDQNAAAQAPAPTPEQVRAADQVFALSNDQAKQVAALLGLQGVVLLGHQMLVENFGRSEEEEDRKPKPRPVEPEGTE